MLKKGKQTIEDKLQEVQSLKQQRDSYIDISNATYKGNSNLTIEWGDNKGATLLNDYHGFSELQKLIRDFTNNIVKELDIKINEKIN